MQVKLMLMNAPELSKPNLTEPKKILHAIDMVAPVVDFKAVEVEDRPCADFSSYKK
jgi:hypothetical protein